LAHHRDDQRETVAHKLLRGSGPLDLAGMPAERPLSAPSATLLIRPLIAIARQDLERYAQRIGLKWREDASNSDLRHRRNRLRHRVLPRLAAGPGLDRLDRLGKNLRERTEALAIQLEKEIFCARRGAAALRPQALAMNGEHLLSLPEPLARRLIERGLERLGSPASPTSAALRQLRLPASSRPDSLELSPGLSLKTSSEDGYWWLEDRRASEDFRPRPLIENERNCLSEWGLDIHLRRAIVGDTAHRAAGAWTQLIPEACGPLTLRPARREDRILPFGRRSERDLALAEYLEKRGVNAARRAHYPVVADELGPLWPLGLPPAERARVALGRPALRITLRPR
jgi:tRNA(Ile)-lysidine synthase